MIAADIWAFFVQKSSRKGQEWAFVSITIEIVIKIGLMAMLVAWKCRGEKTTSAEFRQI